MLDRRTLLAGMADRAGLIRVGRRIWREVGPVPVPGRPEA
jgi:hypothetical protein